MNVSRSRAPQAKAEAPKCPRCGSLDGSLGTSFAYFSCNVCCECVYWTHTHHHPGDWETAILASPWALARRRLEQRGEFGITPEKAAAEIAAVAFPLAPEGEKP